MMYQKSRGCLPSLIIDMYGDWKIFSCTTEKKMQRERRKRLTPFFGGSDINSCQAKALVYRKCT